MSQPEWLSDVDTGTGTSPLDADGDGWNEEEDCNDADPRAFPGNPEVCDDGVDNDCNGYQDEWDQACFPDSSCNIAQGPFGSFGLILLVAVVIRHRARPSAFWGPRPSPH